MGSSESDEKYDHEGIEITEKVTEVNEDGNELTTAQ